MGAEPCVHGWSRASDGADMTGLAFLTFYAAVTEAEAARREHQPEFA